MPPLPLDAQIESLLFMRTQPTSVVWLAEQLGAKTPQIQEALTILEDRLLENRGIVVVRHNDTVMLATHPSMASVIEKLQKKEIKSELSRPALETLAIIAYYGDITKGEIDYIRGVNSQFMLRNLLVRGLIETKENQIDRRRPLYTLSPDSLTFLGITHIEQLPHYHDLKQSLQVIEQEYESYQKDEGDQEDATTQENE